MIFLDYKPVLNHPTLKSKIVFTDSGMCEESVVYMDKEYAPKRETLVWMLIKNHDYNPDDQANDRDVDMIGNPDDDPNDLPDPPEDPPQDHDGNPYWLFRKWMWVSQVYSSEYPANYLKDEEGDPLLKPDGSLDLGDWEDRPGVVKVILHEHKHVLTRQISLDNVNILQRISWIANLYNSLIPIRFFNGMDWQTISEFLLTRKLKLDYEVEYEDPDDPPTILPTEYPPVWPHHCYWKNLSLAECLDDLVKNFECRVVEVPEESSIPTRKDYIELGQDYYTDPVFTRLVWRRRRLIEFRDDIIYKRMEWPVLTAETVEDEANSVIYFPRLHNFFGSTTAHIDGLQPELENRAYSQWRNNWDDKDRSSLDFLCALYPYSDTYMPQDFTDISTYVKENHVNVDTYFAFTTGNLPPDFYTTAEWSKIELRFVNGEYEYYVEHLPRECWFPRQYLSHYTFAHLRGTVKFVNSTTVVVDNLLDTTNNVLVGDNVTLPLQITGNDVQPGSVLNMVISGETLALSSVENPVDVNLEQIPIMWGGENVQTIKWKIDSWDPNISDEDLEVADHATSLDRVFNYTLFEVQDLEQDTGNFQFDEIPYYVPLQLGETFGYSVIPGIDGISGHSKNMMALVFEMRSTHEEIVEYLEASVLLQNSINDHGFIDTIADYWLYHYQRLVITVGLSHTITDFDMFFTEVDFERDETRIGLNSDLVPGQFMAWQVEQASTFPYTYTPDLVTGMPSYASQLSNIKTQGNGLPYSPLRMKEVLWAKYYYHFRTHSATLSLTSTPP